MDKPPQPTARLIQRMRRHARVMRRSALNNDVLEGVVPIKEEALLAMANINDQAAGRLEDLMEARAMLQRMIADGGYIWDIPEDVKRFLDKTKGFE